MPDSLELLNLTMVVAVILIAASFGHVTFFVVRLYIQAAKITRQHPREAIGKQVWRMHVQAKLLQAETQLRHIQAEELKKKKEIELLTKLTELTAQAIPENKKASAAISTSGDAL
jgi:hypothetical protein